MLLGMVSTKVVKRIVKFEILNFGDFFLVLFLGPLNMVVNGNYKMCEILETTSHRAKWTKIWPSGKCLVYTGYF